EGPDSGDAPMEVHVGPDGDLEWAPGTGPLVAAGLPPVLFVADRLWAQQGFRYRDDYLRLVKDDYRASLGLVDFQHPDEAVLAINDWVSLQTRKRIQNLVNRAAIDQTTRLVLTNAVYFRASWASPFWKTVTHNEDFASPDGTRSASMMKQLAYFHYAHLDGVSLVELPYEGRRVSMLVVLPDARDGLADVERRIGRDYERWGRAMASAQVDLWLPRWRTESKFGLSAILEAMGMKLAFCDDANFTGITEEAPIHISDVIQKAYIAADENGTEAAAATAVVMQVDSALRENPEPPKIVVFHADHPFLYILRNPETGAVLFIGRDTQPASSGSDVRATP
ncbi:MAG TPA: serpin family protein, partial [Gemmatimonadaceae bacterium]|nr:serpin family protein [Gemmatimonadaceae bacterium]